MNERTRLVLLMMVLLSILIWLMLPVAEFLYREWRTDGFNAYDSRVDLLLQQMKADNTNASDLTKFLTAIVAGGAFSASIPKGRRQPSSSKATVLVFVALLISAAVAYMGYNVALSHGDILTRQHDAKVGNGGEVAALFSVSRFRFLIILVLNLLGISAAGGIK